MRGANFVWHSLYLFEIFAVKDPFFLVSFLCICVFAPWQVATTTSCVCLGILTCASVLRFVYEKLKSWRLWKWTGIWIPWFCFTRMFDSLEAKIYFHRRILQTWPSCCWHISGYCGALISDGVGDSVDFFLIHYLLAVIIHQVNWLSF